MNSSKHLLMALFLAPLSVLWAAQDNNGNGNNNGSSNGKGSAASTPTKATSAFELPRLKKHGKPGEGVAVPKAHATVHELSSNGKASNRSAKSQGVDFLSVDARTSWSTTVRGAADDVTFVSFFVYASVDTSIDIGGAKLLIKPSTKAGYAQMKIGTKTAKGVQWRDFGGPVKLETYGGASLAALPVLTARLDGAANVWDLYVGSRLGAVDVPLPKLARTAPRQFFVHAGPQGARVCGLISSDDNPIVVDDNRNGIDDTFEKQRNSGTLLSATSGKTARSTVAQAWQRDQQTRQVQAWAVQRPLPDGVQARPAGK